MSDQLKASAAGGRLAKCLKLFLHPCAVEVTVPLGDLRDDTLLDAMQAHLRGLVEDRELLWMYLNGRVEIKAFAASGELFQRSLIAQVSELLREEDESGPNSSAQAGDSAEGKAAEPADEAGPVSSVSCADSEAVVKETQPESLP